VRFWFRWLSNGVSIFLALYLIDSLAGPRFNVRSSAVALIIAVVLGVFDSLIRPLQRARSKPHLAALTTAGVILANALLIQIFVWTGVGLTTTGFLWVLVAASLVTLVSGAISWLIGFNPQDKSRARISAGPRAGGSREQPRRPGKNRRRS